MLVDPQRITPNDTLAWLPLVTAAAGYVAAFATEWVRDNRARRREREARAETRQDARAERVNAFQRETLLALQDASLELMRTEAGLHAWDRKSFRLYGERLKEPYPDDLDNENMLANARTALLGVRVRDENVRKHLQELKNLATQRSLNRLSSEEELVEDMHLAGRAFVALNNRIGQVLRTLDDADSASDKR